MKRFLIAAAAFLMLSTAAYSQQFTGTISASGADCNTTLACVTAPLSNIPGKASASATITVTGTFVATLQFEVSADGGVTWTNAGIASSASVTTISVASKQILRIRCSAYTSGTATVVANVSTAPLGSGSGAALDLSNLTSPTAINLTTLTFAGAAGLTAQGTNQNITLTPSGTGNLISSTNLYATGGDLFLQGSDGSHLGQIQMVGNVLVLAGVAGNAIDLNPGTTVAVGSNHSVTVNGTGSYQILGTGGLLGAASITTGSNCASSASPAVCGSAMAGRFVIAASATSVVVNTTAVTANSEIKITEDQSLGAALSVTCNTGFTQPAVSARTAGTSFTVVISSGLATNPVCFSYEIIN